jgi:hypothetical protein
MSKSDCLSMQGNTIRPLRALIGVSTIIEQPDSFGKIPRTIPRGS